MVRFVSQHRLGNRSLDCGMKIPEALARPTSKNDNNTGFSSPHQAAWSLLTSVWPVISLGAANKPCTHIPPYKVNMCVHASVCAHLYPSWLICLRLGRALKLQIHICSSDHFKQEQILIKTTDECSGAFWQRVWFKLLQSVLVSIGSIMFFLLCRHNNTLSPDAVTGTNGS